MTVLVSGTWPIAMPMPSSVPTTSPGLSSAAFSTYSPPVAAAQNLPRAAASPALSMLSSLNVAAITHSSQVGLILPR